MQYFLHMNLKMSDARLQLLRRGNDYHLINIDRIFKKTAINAKISLLVMLVTSGSYMDCPDTSDICYILYMIGANVKSLLVKQKFRDLKKFF